MGAPSLVLFRTIPLQSPNLPATATGKTTIPLLIKYLHAAAHLENTGSANFALSDIATVQVYVNNKLRMEFVPSDLDKINQFNKLPAYSTDHILTIPFRRFGMVSSPDGSTEIQELVDSGFNTGSYALDDKGTPIPGTSIEEMHIDINWVGGGSLANVTIQPSMESTDALGGGAGIVPSVIATSRPVSGAGVLKIQDLTYGNSQAAILNNVILVPSAGIISEVDLAVKTDYIMKRSIGLHDRIQSNPNKRTPQGSSFVVIDFSESGYGNMGLPVAGLTRNELSVEPTFSQANTCQIYEFVFGSL